MKSIVFLASFRGSNMEAVLKKIKSSEINAKAIALVTDKEDAGAIQIAKGFGVPTYTIPYKNYKENKNEFHRIFKETVIGLNPDLIITAGYLRILESSFISHFKNRIINIHPSLLPSFKGLHAQKQAIDAGVKIAGCTTHFVVEEVDAGPIIMQGSVPVPFGITEEEL